MKLNEKFNISESKVQTLLQRIEDLGLDLNDIEESFSKGTGSGGQKVNKTSNKVTLLHLPTGLQVSCQRERERNKNRFIALRALVEKIESKFGKRSSIDKKTEKIRRQKKRRKRRNKKSVTE